MRRRLCATWCTVCLAASLLAQEPRPFCDPGPSCLPEVLQIVFPPAGSPADDGSPYQSTLQSYSLGDTIATRVVVEAETDGIQSWSYAVKHDAGVLTLLEDTLTTDGTIVDPDHPQTVSLEPVYNLTEVVEGGYISAIVLSLQGTSHLPLGRQAVLNASYTLVADAGPTGTKIEFADHELHSPGEPPVGILLVVQGEAFQPITLIDGRIGPAVVDQEWLPGALDHCLTLGAGQIGGGWAAAQSFTAGVEGTLAGIELGVEALPDAGRLSVELRPVDTSGMPSSDDGAVLFSTTLDASSFWRFPAPTPIDLRSTGIRMQPGRRLAVTISTPDPPVEVGTPQYRLCGREGYAGGTALMGITSIPPWMEASWDLSFCTYIDPDPNVVDQEWLPSAPDACLSLGAGLVGGGYEAAQTLTAGVEGFLGWVELGVEALPDAGRLALRVVPVGPDGLPSDGGQLYSVTLDAASFWRFPMPTPIDVRSAGIRVSPGDRLALVFSAPDPPVEVGVPQYELCGREGYAGGTALMGITSIPPWMDEGWDLSFRTFVVPPPPPFLRGDCDGDGLLRTSVNDAIANFQYCFTGRQVPCVAACDATADGNPCTGVSDGLQILLYLFRGGPPLDAPFPECGTSALASDAMLGCKESGCE